MNASSPPTPHLSSRDDVDLADYRRFAFSALAGLVLALAGFAALVEPALWPLPWLGLVASGWALWRIAHGERLSGRGVAWGGVGLSLLCVTAVAAEGIAYQELIRREAARFATCYLDFLLFHQPWKALQLTKDPRVRQPLDDAPPQTHLADATQVREFDTYLSGALPRALSTLRPPLAVHCQSFDIRRSSEHDDVQVLCGVRGTADGRPKTVYVTLTLQRAHLENPNGGWVRGRAGWVVLRGEETTSPLPQP